MKNMKGQLVLSHATEKAWKMYVNNEIISKINTQMLAHAGYIQGDGSPGSLRLFKLGPGRWFAIFLWERKQGVTTTARTKFSQQTTVHSYVKESMEKIENVEKGRSVTLRVVDGKLMSLYDPYRVSFSFIPMEGKENEMCVTVKKIDRK